MSMEQPEFEALVEQELDRLPDAMVEGLDNVVFMVEDRHESEELLGIYEGTSITDRGNYGFMELPDRIVVFRETHLARCDSLDELRDEVHTTLVHEIAHYYGFDDDELHRLGWA